MLIYAIIIDQFLDSLISANYYNFFKHIIFGKNVSFIFRRLRDNQINRIPSKIFWNNTYLKYLLVTLFFTIYTTYINCWFSCPYSELFRFRTLLCACLQDPSRRFQFHLLRFWVSPLWIPDFCSWIPDPKRNEKLDCRLTYKNLHINSLQHIVFNPLLSNLLLASLVYKLKALSANPTTPVYHFNISFWITPGHLSCQTVEIRYASAI